MSNDDDLKTCIACGDMLDEHGQVCPFPTVCDFCGLEMEVYTQKALPSEESGESASEVQLWGPRWGSA